MTSQIQFYQLECLKKYANGGDGVGGGDGGGGGQVGVGDLIL